MMGSLCSSARKPVMDYNQNNFSITSYYTHAVHLPQYIWEAYGSI